jgi:hypothetical protein
MTERLDSTALGGAAGGGGPPPPLQFPADVCAAE